MIPPRQTLNLALALIATIFIISIAQPLRPALTKEAFHILLHPSSAPSQSHSPPPSANKRPHFPNPLIFIPGFQGTLLSHDSHPLFLSPLTQSTYLRTYDLLRLAPHLDVGAVEYPAVTCAPSPMSHIGHCHPLPARGPVHALFTFLRAKGVEHIYPVGFDWRHDVASILRETSFPYRLTRQVEEAGRPVLIAAHGYGCSLAAAFLAAQTSEWKKNHVLRFVCSGGTLRSTASAREAIQKGEGMFTAGMAHRYADAAMNIREEGRLDFRAMEFELGLRRGTRRDHLPKVNGVWDDKDGKMSPVEERIKLTRRFGALQAMAQGVGKESPGVGVTCVVGVGLKGGDGVVERASAEACAEWEGAAVEKVDVKHFNLTGMVGELVLQVLSRERTGGMDEVPQEGRHCEI